MGTTWMRPRQQYSGNPEIGLVCEPSRRATIAVQALRLATRFEMFQMVGKSSSRSLTRNEECHLDEALQKLLSISSSEIVGTSVDADRARVYLQKWGPIGNNLTELLCLKNGFWAYESSLLLRPFQSDSPPLGIVEWNQCDLWKDSYCGSLGDYLFFAEDVFGCQFCLGQQGVCLFDPETCQFERLGDTLGGWAKVVLDDYEYRTGYPLSHSWQLKNGPLLSGSRLLPRVPFVLGGKFELENLYTCNDVEGMRFRSSIANQIRDVPDGADVIL